MIGYHLTSEKNWKAIADGGLVPYRNPNFDLVVDAGALRGLTIPRKGIFLWSELPDGVDLAGCVFDRFVKLASSRIVLLEVRYRKAEAISEDCTCRRAGQDPDPDCPNDHWRLRHVGSFYRDEGERGRQNHAYYHRARPFVVLTEPVQPGRIKLVATFDIAQMFRARVPVERRKGTVDLSEGWDQ